VLHDFLTANRDELIALCQAKVAKRLSPLATDRERQHGIPLFLEQLAETLRREQFSNSPAGRHDPGPSEPGKRPATSAIGVSAAKHGSELQQRGYTVDQVIHDYGDLCQSITELAVKRNSPLTTDEFQSLNRYLDNAIAEAVTEFERRRDRVILEEGTRNLNERLGYLAHELRNLLSTALLTVAAIRRGNVGLAGATGAVLDRSLLGMSEIIARTLADVRLTAGIAPLRERVAVAELVAEVQLSAALEAQAHQCELTIFPVEHTLMVDIDRQLFSSALGNLLQNAFKFTRPRGHVCVRAFGREDRVFIEVEDECGGLAPNTIEELFQPFKQQDGDRTGLGLGLSLAKRAVESNAGTLHARNLPGRGCVFTMNLPAIGAAQ
jgi:signal transduction histidine kinase